MDKQTGPKGFLVVLPGEIIEIPQNSEKSWLTLFLQLAARTCGKVEASLRSAPLPVCGLADGQV